MAGTRIPGEPAEGTEYSDGLDRDNLETANSTEGDSNFTEDGFYAGIVVGWESNYTVCDRSGFRLEAHEVIKNWDGLTTRPGSVDHKHPTEFSRRTPAERGRGSKNPEDEVVYLDKTVYLVDSFDDGFVKTNDLGGSDTINAGGDPLLGELADASEQGTIHYWPWWSFIIPKIEGPVSNVALHLTGGPDSFSSDPSLSPAYEFAIELSNTSAQPTHLGAAGTNDPSVWTGTTGTPGSTEPMPWSYASQRTIRLSGAFNEWLALGQAAGSRCNIFATPGLLTYPDPVEDTRISFSGWSAAAPGPNPYLTYSEQGEVD